jgi:hypothetical protein
MEMLNVIVVTDKMTIFKKMVGATIHNIKTVASVDAHGFTQM